LLAGCGEGAEIGGERDPRQLALEDVGVLLAIAGMMQQAIDIIEDGPLVDFLVLVVFAELLQGRIDYVLATVRADFVINLDGKRTSQSVDGRI
jgi:hypothetical protein